MHQQLKANILIVDYRGYGDSEDGTGPCQTGFIKDAVATYKWLVDRARKPPPSMRTRIRIDLSAPSPTFDDLGIGVCSVFPVGTKGVQRDLS